VKAQLAALGDPSADIAFLAGHIDAHRVAISGHSQGACVAAGLSTLPDVKVVIPMTGSLQVLPSPSLESVMFIAGMQDNVIGWDQPRFGNYVCESVPGQDPATDNKAAYEKSPGPPGVKKRLVGIAGGGHLAPTDLCQTNAQGRNAVQEAEQDGVCGVDQAVIIGLPGIFDCGTLDMKTGIQDVNYASTAALEETLMCADESAAFTNLRTANPSIGEFDEAK
jgi:acetyl esterase/lipase